MDAGPTTALPAARLEQVRTGDVVVLRPVGRLDDALADDIRERALGAHAPVVIDLDRCRHVDGSAIERIASAWTLYRPEMCLACSDAGDRQMLESHEPAGTLAVFASVEQAVAARAGLPGGWERSDGPVPSPA